MSQTLRFREEYRVSSPTVLQLRTDKSESRLTVMGLRLESIGG